MKTLQAMLLAIAMALPGAAYAGCDGHCGKDKCGCEENCKGCNDGECHCKECKCEKCKGK